MERLAITVRGIVQGVGFRPFVHHLASRLRLHGFVKNQSGSVLIEVEGEPPSLQEFLALLSGQPPPLAHIDQISWEPRAPRADEQFLIQPSAADSAGTILISADVAVAP